MRAHILRCTVAVLSLTTLVGCSEPKYVDLLLAGALVYDGTGSEPSVRDVGILGDRIAFVGRAADADVRAEQALRVDGLLLVPGFIDMHSHAMLTEDYGRNALPFLYQGITTVALGVDGGGSPEVAALLDGLDATGIGVNAFTYVGHGRVREMVLGMEDRSATDAEMEEMKALVRKAMQEGAFGLSSGLFYVPGYYASTEEVIALAAIAAEFDGIYDTHDRDLGATFRGIGYLNSILEAIRIGEESGARVIFSHFNAQGTHNYGRAPQGIKLVNDARARGVEVAAAQHVYTATQSSLSAYTIPRWASAGGREAMLERFRDAEVVAQLDIETMEMLKIRGGPEKIRFTEPRPDLNGRTLAEVSALREATVPQTVRKILAEGNVAVMNLELYDMVNTRHLATQPWMMTCTDGKTPPPGAIITHPRVYGAFTRKLRQFVLDEELISMAFAVRSMSGLAADFLHLSDRGYVHEGMIADLVILSRDEIRTRATYDDPHHLAEGTVHVLVNGEFVIRDGQYTGALAGRAIRRPTSAETVDAP
jgi:N-acyl-D-amino-acid deacylase